MTCPFSVASPLVPIVRIKTPPPFRWRGIPVWLTLPVSSAASDSMDKNLNRCLHSKSPKSESNAGALSQGKIVVLAIRGDLAEVMTRSKEAEVMISPQGRTSSDTPRKAGQAT